MAINKAVRAALSILSYPELDIKRTYMVEREINKLLAHRSKNTSLYRVWDHPVLCGGRHVPVHLFPRRSRPGPLCWSSFTAEAG